MLYKSLEISWKKTMYYSGLSWKFFKFSRSPTLQWSNTTYIKISSRKAYTISMISQHMLVSHTKNRNAMTNWNSGLVHYIKLWIHHLWPWVYFAWEPFICLPISVRSYLLMTKFWHMVTLNLDLHIFRTKLYFI